MGARSRGPGAKVARGGSPIDAAGVKKRTMAPANGLRHDAHALMALAAATQHAAGQEAPPRLPQPAENYLEPAARQESVSSDNDYSEEQYQMEKQQLQQQQQQRSAPRSSGGGGAGTAESEEEKKEKRRLANREAARRMRRRRATHMAAVEEEVERLSQENSLLLHRMSQLVASHQAVDAENAQLRADLMTLRASVGACLQAGQLDMAAPSLAAAVSNGTISPSLVVPVPRPTPVAAVPTGEPVAAERPAPAAAAARRLVEPQEGAGGLPPSAAGGQASGVPSSSGGQSTENEMTATEEERARYSGGNAPARPDGSFATSGEALPSASRTQRKKGSAWKAAGSWLADN
ncbi:probable regulatory protein opaque-2 at N-terminal half [Coccomyxa sp. Obi]|nr:probable regulatory protein opaque-2 at N-terminal half [Coccomyxa sp. Obi]